MHRQKSRRRSAARLVGWGLVIGAYATTLILAADLSAAGNPGVAAAGAVEAAQAAVLTANARAAEAAPAAQELATEAPLATLAVAGGLVVFGGIARLVAVLRRPRRRRTYLVARHVTTLT